MHRILILYLSYLYSALCTIYIYILSLVCIYLLIFILYIKRNYNNYIPLDYLFMIAFHYLLIGLHLLNLSFPN